MSLPAIPDPASIDATADPAAALVALVEPATAWLAQASNVSDVKEFHAKAKAIEQYVRAQGLTTQAVVSAQTILLRSAQVLGRLMPKETGGRGKKLSEPRIVSVQDASRFRKLADNPDVVNEIIATGDPEKLSVNRVLSRIERQRRQNVDDDARQVDADITLDSETDIDGRWSMHPGDMDDILSELAPQSVDAIVTDPPYPAESLPLWSTLAEHAKRILVPDGLLIALTGQILLPDVMERVGKHLTFGWMYCQPLPATQSRIRGRNIYQGWKPWLVYTTGTWPSGRIDWHTDVLDEVPAEKGNYAWQQSVLPAMQLIERLVPNNGVVLDPFTGSGSYGEAALSTGRRFIGVEADSERFKQAVERLEKMT